MNYIGSKYSLLDFLTTTIADVTGITQGNDLVFADLFAGTGVVGQTYRSLGFHVIANDIQYYSYVLNRHLLGNTAADADPALLEHLNTLPPAHGFVYENYCPAASGRMYFTDENGGRCDAIRLELNHLLAAGEITENTYYFYLAALINSIDKVANTASVYGAYLKHFKRSALQPLRLEPLPVVDGPVGEAYNRDISELIADIHGEILYLDPPYNSRQYNSNYHVLETIARYDDPQLTGVTGLRAGNDGRSLFCSRRQVEQVFDALIRDADFHFIFLSYNNEGLMTPETIRNIMSRYGEYRLFTRDDYKRFQADTADNRNIAADTTVEYLHCLVR